MDRRFHPASERERCCAEKARRLIESMERIYEDLRSETSDCYEKSSNDNSPPHIKSHRSSIKHLESAIFVKNMEADALRRALEINQEDLGSLVEEKRKHLLLADQAILMPDAPALPRLPEEILSMIFTALYFTEHLGYSWDESTVNRLLDDDKTPDKLKAIIQRGIPNVVADNSVGDLHIYLDSIADVIGPCPNSFSTQKLDESEDIDSQTKVSVVIRSKTWPSADVLASLSRVIWKQIFIGYEPRNDREQQDFLLDLFQKPEVRCKLSDVEFLEVPHGFCEFPSEADRPLTPGRRNLKLEIKTVDVDERCGSQLRTARLGLPALQTLRPIILQITDLELTIQPFMTNINIAIDAIRPLSRTLVNLSVWGPHARFGEHTGFDPQPAVEQGNMVPFPRLKYLKLAHMSEKKSRDMLSIFQCPELEEIAVERPWHSNSQPKVIYDSSQYVSVDFLHEKVPFLKRLHLYTELQQGLQMLAQLAKPDANCGGNWLLPQLDTIILDRTQGPILKTLTEVVVNRMRSHVPISCIRSVTLPGFSDRFANTLQRAYLSTLNLLVPEVKFS